MHSMSPRKPVVAGQFYPEDELKLSTMLKEMFDNQEDLSVSKHISGIIAPHAGYIYSGNQAAKAYKQITSKEYKLVCVISPSHRVYFDTISICPHAAYISPLGEMPVDLKAGQLVLACKGIDCSIKGHVNEHALEVQLPFIQHVLGNIPILPMVMGDQSMSSIDKLAHAISVLHKEYGDDILFVASSDLSHFHSAKLARRMDGKFIELLQKADSDLLYNLLYSEEIEACGAGPILALLKGLKIDETMIQVLGYTHSGQVSQDNSSVVGYTSALLMKDEDS